MLDEISLVQYGNNGFDTLWRQVANAWDYNWCSVIINSKFQTLKSYIAASI